MNELGRRTFLMGLPAAALSGFQARPRQPNIVIALCDDLGWGDLGCHGHPVIRTPRLDAFARQGMRFTDGYASAPVCSPSRAGLLTGRTPNRCGIYDWISEGSPVHLKRDETTLASLLRDAGYSTAHIGKWHLNGKMNDVSQTQPPDHGFSHWFSTQNNAAPSHENPVNFIRNGKPLGPMKGYSSTLIVDEAVQWIKDQPAGKPWFVFLCFHSPHEPVASGEEFTRLYPSASKRGEALYYGNVSQMDHEFGRLMDYLDVSGQSGRTLVNFTSDNGPETLNRYAAAWRSHGSPGPLRSMKLSLYEGGTRVPFMVRWPGRVKPGQVSSEPVCSLDWMATLGEVLSLRPPPKQLDGENILPLLEGRRMRRERGLHWHYFNSLGAPKAALRDGDWKVLGMPADGDASRPGGGFVPARDMGTVKGMKLGRFELYNLKQDRAEQRDLSAAEPKQLARMRERLLALHEEVTAEAPVWN